MPQQNTKACLTQGLHHLGLTVKNVKEAADFFISILGYQVIGEKPDYPAIFISDGNTMLTLWQAIAPHSASDFNRHTQIGLHHFAIKIADLSALNQIYSRLIAHPKTTVEFPPEPLSGVGAQHMMCIIPGGLRVEFIVLPE